MESSAQSTSALSHLFTSIRRAGFAVLAILDLVLLGCLAVWAQVITEPWLIIPLVVLSTAAVIVVHAPRWWQRVWEVMVLVMWLWSVYALSISVVAFVDWVVQGAVSRLVYSPAFRGSFEAKDALAQRVLRVLVDPVLGGAVLCSIPSWLLARSVWKRKLKAWRIGRRLTILLMAMAGPCALAIALVSLSEAYATEGNLRAIWAPGRWWLAVPVLGPMLWASYYFRQRVRAEFEENA